MTAQWDLMFNRGLMEMLYTRARTQEYVRSALTSLLLDPEALDPWEESVSEENNYRAGRMEDVPWVRTLI